MLLVTKGIAASSKDATSMVSYSHRVDAKCLSRPTSGQETRTARLRGEAEPEVAPWRLRRGETEVIHGGLDEILDWI